MYAAVILDKGLDLPLDYALIEKVSVGTRVLVPVQSSLRKGTVVALKDTPSVAKVQPIKEILSEEALIGPDLFRLADWMSRYYCTSFRKILKVLLPATIRKETQEKEQLFVRRLLPPKKLATLTISLRENHPSQAKVLDALIKRPKGILLTELLEESGTSRSPVTTLEKDGILKIDKLQINRSPLEDMEFFPTKPKVLSDEQQIAFDRIIKNLKSFQTHLIHGVTGSGKTEIYLQAIAKARKQGLGIILLVPEIALTSQTIERLKSRFTEKMGILHHRLSDGERFDIWHGIRKGDIQIVVGARSAIFSPVKNLGLIIVDEEHESSYKQTDEEPCYHARDVAIMRGKFSSATVVLGSATPSLESYANAKAGKYTLSTLMKRAKNASLPEVKVVDMKTEYAKSEGFTLFCSQLIDAIKLRLEKGEQTLLFLNRRGYHAFQMCAGCGEIVKCPHCSVSLTFHKKTNHLACHLCSYVIAPPPTECPLCKEVATLHFKGVGTEQVERTLHALFPDIRTLRMDADTTRHKGSHDLLFKQFRSGKADVLIGTQMIAKGLHFPAVTLVGVLNSDGALNLPDFRSGENVFQLLTQVSGRSGRGDLKGEVIVQSSLKGHPIFQHASKEDYKTFFNEEMEARELFAFPPFSRLTKLIFSGKNEGHVKQIADTFHRALLKNLPSDFTLYPVIPCGYAKIKDNFRFKLLIKGTKPLLLSSILMQLRLETHLPRSIRLLVDVDPTSIFS
ncbi:primosomal protein N' [Candidatus Neptunichlamydia sp. REUL1]|uniref:primosomal protein N' n=1 Tax=Candidatus Neptunichlamydia sp. REUL1 TaxID=3064277 RepID=UPI00292CDDEE|nr:primosomal protein N' [Candidatus Neptunochlamydia sp. REUL1]